MELLLMENPIPLFLARGKLTLGLYKCLTRLEMELAMEGGRASEWPFLFPSFLPIQNQTPFYHGSRLLAS